MQTAYIQSGYIQPAYKSAVVVVAIVLAACATDPGGDCAVEGIDCRATIEVADGVGVTVQPGGVVSWSGAQVGAKRWFEIRNTSAVVAAAPLIVTGITLAGRNAEEFACDDGTGAACAADSFAPILPQGTGSTVAHAGPTKFAIRRVAAGTETSVAHVHIHVRGDPDFADKPFSFAIKARPSRARIHVQPATLELPFVPVGQVSKGVITVRNTGDETLRISSATLSGDPGFGASFQPNTWLVGTEVKPFAAPLVIAPGASFQVPVRFTSQTDKPRQAVLYIHSNAANPAAGRASVLANSNAPCVLVAPPSVDFGGVLVGKSATHTVQISNCGGGDIAVESLKLGGKHADRYAVKGAPKTPFALGVNGTFKVQLRYQPESVAAIDSATGMPSFDIGVLTVVGSVGQRRVKLRGHGVDKLCPVAAMTVKEGEEVIPQTTLHLSGLKSNSVAGQSISTWKWTLSNQPQGSTAQFLPSSSSPTPTLTANVAGEYVICLAVTDNLGHTSCSPACTTVLVIPSEAIHVELLWKTPADPDETDTTGADLDLHFAHPFGSASGPDQDCDGKPDPWFQVPFDTFWFNEKPNWGSAAKKDDDPGLDLDDTDGAGPENLNLDAPEGTSAKPVHYDVGVHYWRDHGWGDSHAEVRVYIQSQLVWQEGPVKMRAWDMWHVGRVNWPNSMAGGTLDPFVACRETGSLCAGGKAGATKTKAKKWVPKGQRCMTSCYKATSMPQTGGLPKHCAP